MITDRTDTYQEFLSRKQLIVPPAGIDVSADDLHPALFPFQRQIVAWALRRGRAAVFSDCGTGKTPMQLSWADEVCRASGGDVLILAPLAVAQQTVREGQKFSIQVTVCRTADDLRPGINVANYERLHHFEAARFKGLVLDECFASDTLVDTPTGRKYIKDIRAGDIVRNAAGDDTVSDIHRRKVSYAIRITVGGESIICSPNHPFFTRRGWVGTQDLIPGDEIMAVSTAVRMVRETIHSAIRSSREDKILREILFSEMADESTGTLGKSTYAGSCGKEGSETPNLVSVGKSKGASRNRARQESQSLTAARSAREDIPHIESDPPQTFRTWGQWNGIDETAGDLTGCTRYELDSGISFVIGRTDSRLSNVLQARLSESRAANQYRGGWILPRSPSGPGYQKGCEDTFSWVDRLEVLEPGHLDLERYRDADGCIYFYDLGATRHPSYSVNGLLVHNSSILKGFGGIMRKAITEFGSSIPYRLACTATPAPNDLIELTNHAEFLDVMSGKEIIALFFTQDGNTTHHWRLKGHAKTDFWRWMASWSVAIRKPSDLGDDDGAFILPPLHVHQVTVDAPPPTTTLFPVEALTLQERQQARRESIGDRVRACADLVNNSTEPWLIWCNLNRESAALVRAIPGAVEVVGADTPEFKEKTLFDFAEGRLRVLVCKPTIAGWGLNFQRCAHVAFVGLSDSYEQYYQAIRRCWRYGQTRAVECYVITAETEGAVVQNIERKERQATTMFGEIVAHMRGLSLGRQERNEMTYESDVATGNGWTLYLGDSVETIDRIETDSVGLMVTSPPFPGMYAYTNSVRDLGNTESIEQMIEQFKFLIGPGKLLRVVAPGRMACVHLMQLTAMKSRDGYIGLKDYRGRVIQMMIDAGWIYAGEVTIEKNPQIQAVRNNERGLLFKSLAMDSSVMRMALADYLICFRKPGENVEKIQAGISKRYNDGKGWITEEEWIEWASPVWHRRSKLHPNGIQETRVLNVRQARETDDERHLCPLQLDVIERAVKLWSAPGDLVYDPFTGIGSVPAVAIKLGRCGVGCDLKRSYFESAIQNLQDAEASAKSPDLFSLMGVEVAT